jgi:AbrB family looped-hinge helix DNA binding protein
MKHAVATVSSEGEVIVPAAMLRSLGLKVGDKVALTVDGDSEVRLTPATDVVSRTAGMMYTGEKPLSAEELRRVAEDAIAADVMERSRRR